MGDMQVKIQNLEQELSLKQWNVDSKGKLYKHSQCKLKGFSSRTPRGTCCGPEG